jgi:hypothetical protein
MKKLIPSLAVLALLATSAHAAPHAISAMIHDYDKNGDGKVTLEEFNAERKIRFDRTDADHNGTLSEDEYVTEFDIRWKATPSTETDPERIKEDYQRQIRQTHVRFGVLDTDHNGAMTWDEYQVSGHAMFERQDRDHNKQIDETDRKILEQEEKDKKGDDFIAP